jgi:N-acyl-D-aspartate/D-glutamate deacylase
MDLILENGLVFDGRGAPGKRAHVGIEDGIVVEISETPIARGPNTHTVDCSGCWVTPGFLDIHTHYDAEVEVSPALFESVRHGVTTVMLGSCSLSLVCGDPTDLADMFCRVEAIPRTVVKPLLERIKDWDGPAEYLSHLDQLPLGPNVACMLGHSTIRAHAMGLGRSLSKDTAPTDDELERMDRLLEEAMNEGFVGLSISTLPWDKMDGESFRSRPMPSVFATWKEYRRFASVLRERGRVLQAVPNLSTKANVPLFYLLSTGLFRKALKTTLISMMDVEADRFAFRIAGWLSRLFNEYLGADFRMQALPEVFDLWADGIDLVVFEEFEAGTAALHLQDAVARNELLGDPEYRARFKKQWRNKYLPKAFHRNFRHTRVLECPDARMVGRSFYEIGKERGQDPVDAFLDLVIEHGNALRWYSVLGNDRPKWLQWIVSHPDILIGFSDAGAHLRNMAHYNFPLRLLRMASDTKCMTIERAVQRLTSEIAEWFDLDAGVLEVGARADVAVIDPRGLTDAVERVQEQALPEFGGLVRLVRRNDEAVRAVLINGKLVAERGAPAPGFGTLRGFGRVLRAGANAEAAAGKVSDAPRSTTIGRRSSSSPRPRGP